MATLRPLVESADQPAVTIADVRAAHARIADAIVRTPTLHSRTLSQLTGAEIWLS